MILSIVELKSLLNSLTRKLDGLQAPKQNGIRDNVKAAEDPLFGLKADMMEVWNNFDQRLRRDRKFFDAVVTI